MQPLTRLERTTVLTTFAVQRGIALLALLGLGICSCAVAPALHPAAPARQLVAPSEHGLPAPGELPRSASSTQVQVGISCVAQQGGTAHGSELVLSLHTTGENAEGQPEEIVLPYAFATYVFSGMSQPPAALHITALGDYETEFWIGLADWNAGTWDFSPGHFFSSPGIALGGFEGGPEKYVSSDGRLAVAIILGVDKAPLRIQQLELTQLSDVNSFAASTNRWDGVLLSWSKETGADGYMLYRRLADSGSVEPWIAFSSEPFSRSVLEYLDSDVDGCRTYDYILKTGYRIAVNGELRWMYSSGALASGQRQVTSVGPGPQDLATYWPTSFYNRVSFFWQPSDVAEGIKGLRNEGFPAVDDWQEMSISSDGTTPAELLTMEGFAPPFMVQQSQEINAATVTIGWSTAEGTFAQVVTTDADGLTLWEPPVQVREAGSYFLGFLQMPRRMGCVTWNPQLNRMELVDSADLRGRVWYEFQPNDFPWMIIGNRRPEGALEMHYFTAAELISYREAGSGDLVVIRHDFNAWTDISPGIKSGIRPRVVQVMAPGQPAGFGVVFLDDTGRRIRLIRQTSDDSWLVNEIEDLLIAKDGQTISEFDLYTIGEVSYANYLAYVLNDDLYFCYTNHPGLQDFDSPVLVDGSNDISHLNLIRVGTDDEGTKSNLFATYYSHDADNVLRINFRDLLALQPLSN